MSTLSELEKWYSDHCVDEWQEGYGVEIGTLDNPGWSLKVDVVGTELAKQPFEEYKVERSDSDWVHARRNDTRFEAFGGPGNLKEMLQVFLAWSKQNG